MELHNTVFTQSGLQIFLSIPKTNIQLFRQVSACTRFRARTVAVHTLEKQDAAIVKDKRNTGKKWNPSAIEH